MSKYWIMRDGNKNLPSKMSEQHLFYAWKKFGREFGTLRSDMLNKEIKKRDLPHPKQFNNINEFNKAINSKKIKKRLCVK